jgi:flagellar motor switch protein FliM
MSQEPSLLSQQDIDQLIKSVQGLPSEGKIKSKKHQAESIDLSLQAQLAKGHMPTLDIIHERFSNSLKNALFSYIRRHADVIPHPLRIQKYSDFIAHLPVPSNLNLCSIKPFEGQALIACDPNLIFFIVDNLFGSDGRFHTRVEGRDFTPTEHRIIRRILELIFTAYQEAWHMVESIECSFVRSEINTQFANIAVENEIVLTAQIDINFEGKGGPIYFCFPRGMFEPVRDTLSDKNYGATIHQSQEWTDQLKHNITQAEIEIIADLADFSMTLREVAQLREGDVLMQNVPGQVIAKITDKAIFSCQYGSHNGKYALKIIDILADAGDLTEIGLGAVHDDSEKSES